MTAVTVIAYWGVGRNEKPSADKLDFSPVAVFTHRCSGGMNTGNGFGSLIKSLDSLLGNIEFLANLGIV